MPQFGNFLLNNNAAFGAKSSPHQVWPFLISHVPLPPFVLTWVCPNTATPCFRTFGLFLEPSFCGSNPIENVVGSDVQAAGGVTTGGKVLVWLQFHVLLFWGVCWPAGLPLVVVKEYGWLMSATCVPWDMPRGNTGLSKHGDAVFPHCCLCPPPSRPRVQRTVCPTNTWCSDCFNLVPRLIRSPVSEYMI